MKTFNAAPSAGSHIKTLGKIGYNLNTAISDIIDNSISAESSNIRISFDHVKRIITILDDGYGMERDELKQNMVIGCKDPSDVREKNDLGRFGSGMKTASFSVADKLTVISKTKSTPLSAFQWDVQKVIETDDWCLSELNNTDISNINNQLNENDQSGTELILDNIKRYKDIKRKIY